MSAAPLGEQLASMLSRPPDFDAKSVPIRWSNLKLMCRSAAHYRYGIQFPRADSAAMRLGRYVHQLLLGGDPFVIWTGDRRAGKVWEAFAEEHSGEEIVTAKEAALALGMVESVRANDTAMELLTTGLPERHVDFTMAGRACSMRADVYTPNEITELKTTTDASPGRFPYLAKGLAYHAQLAWYMNGLRAAGLADPKRAAIVAVESKPPYVVQLFDVYPRALELGERIWRSCWEQVRICEDTAHFPGYVEGFAPFDLPEDDEPIFEQEEE